VKASEQSSCNVAILVTMWHERAGQGAAMTFFSGNIQLLQSMLCFKFNY
jgi:hypothetical protein